MESYTERTPRKPRGIGARPCLICRKKFKPLSERAKRCGACEARHQAWLAEHGLSR